MEPSSSLLMTVEHDLTWISKLRRNIREPAAEFLGVFIMICFGDGSVAQVNLSNKEYGEYQSISWCWGIGVMVRPNVSLKSLLTSSSEYI